jgi:FkbM family methyltransferase
MGNQNKTYSYSYVFGTKVLVSEESYELNEFTWKNNQVIHDLSIIEPWLKYIKPGDTVLDIGAQSGMFTLSAKLYPETTWYAFEPDPDNYNCLKQNLELNSITNVITSQEALSDSVGSKTLNIYCSHRGVNTLGKNYIPFGKDMIHLEVKTNTIDNLFSDKSVDLIKIDTEGAEYDILIGGIETIERCKPNILLEYSADKLGQFGHTVAEFEDLLRNINYEVAWIARGGSDIFIQSKEKQT